MDVLYLLQIRIIIFVLELYCLSVGVQDSKVFSSYDRLLNSRISFDCEIEMLKNTPGGLTIVKILYRTKTSNRPR